MKAIIYKFLCFCLMAIPISHLQAQPFNRSTCNVNVYSPLTINSEYRAPVVNATFKVVLNRASCTGTLVNRNTPDGEVGFYFITANHCFESVINSEQWFEFMFNYQSPNHNTLDTDLTIIFI